MVLCVFLGNKNLNPSRRYPPRMCGLMPHIVKWNIDITPWIFGVVLCLHTERKGTEQVNQKRKKKEKKLHKTRIGFLPDLFHLNSETIIREQKVLPGFLLVWTVLIIKDDTIFMANLECEMQGELEKKY